MFKTLAGIQSFGAFLQASTSQYILSDVFFDKMFAELSMETEHEEGGVQRDRTSTKAEDARAYSRVQVVSYPLLMCSSFVRRHTAYQDREARVVFFLAMGQYTPYRAKQSCRGFILC